MQTNIESLNLRINKQRGIALIQVLLLSTLFSLLAIQLSLTARQQVNSAVAINQRVQVEMQAYSVQNIVLFKLLTNEVEFFDDIPEIISKLQFTQIGDTQVEISEKVSVSVRDLAGMLSTRFPKHPLWARYLNGLGFTQEQIVDIIRFLKDVQDFDDVSVLGKEPSQTRFGLPYLNRPFQTQTELKNYLQEWPVLQAQINQSIHHYAHYEVNLAEANELVLSAAFGPNVAQTLIAQKEDVDFFQKTLERLANGRLPAESYTTLNSGNLRVLIEVQKDEILWKESFDVKLARTQTPPFIIIGRDPL